MMKRYTLNTRGVTLTEMLTVVAIIGILATIAVPNFIGIIRNHRTRTAAMTLLHAIRRERARALSVNRSVAMDIDGTAKTYDVRLLQYTFYDPYRVFGGEDTEAERTEPERTLLVGQTFDPKDGLSSVDPSGTLTLLFNASGTIRTGTPDVLTIALDGHDFGYTLKIYRGGQIVLDDRTQ